MILIAVLVFLAFLIAIVAAVLHFHDKNRALAKRQAKLINRIEQTVRNYYELTTIAQIIIDDINAFRDKELEE